MLASLPPVNWTWVLLGALSFVVVSAGGLAVVRVLLIRMPPDYFSRSRSRTSWMDAHPVLRWAGLILKNAIGAALVVLGIVLSMPGVPGPGFLTILLGVTLMDFPGKRRLERWLIGRPSILQPVNRLRERHGKAPLVMDHLPAPRE